MLILGIIHQRQFCSISFWAIFFPGDSRNHSSRISIRLKIPLELFDQFGRALYQNRFPQNSRNCPDSRRNQWRTIKTSIYPDMQDWLNEEEDCLATEDLWDLRSSPAEICEGLTSTRFYDYFSRENGKSSYLAMFSIHSGYWFPVPFCSRPLECKYKSDSTRMTRF